jgi:hypothetical protein
MLASYKGLNFDFKQKLTAILERVKKGNEIQNASSNMLLLNVEDILGYA